VDETPVFVREGAIIPEQGVSQYSDEKLPVEQLIVNVYGSDQGSFDLYEDDGSSLRSDEQGQHAHTVLTHAVSSDGSHHLVIEPAQGTYAGQRQERAYELRILGSGRPSAVTINGARGHWTWDSQRAAALITLPGRSIRERVSVEWR
jgi:alpha-glucosidase (family GH31 glycosyl hydrolase)